jgi:diguanylate cyclase (GGDEF)-like protein
MNKSEAQKLDILTSILNGISAMIYVTELETDKILFINDYMKQHFGIERDVIGQPCYKVLNQGIEKRCDWCPCHRLDKEPDAEIVWEELNTLTGCHYRNSDRYIDWPNGKKAHIQLCVDISDVKQMQETLEKNNKLLESVNKAASILLDLNIDEDIDLRIMSSMEIIGNSINADRVHIWRMYIADNDTHFTHEYEWLSEIGKNKSEVPKGMITPFVNMSGWKEKFLRNEYVGGPFSKLSPDEQDYFLEFDIKSVVLIPIFLEEHLWGLVSVDDCMQERYFSDEELSLLQSLSLMIASAIERHDLYVKDKKSKERMMLMLDTSPLCTQIWDRNLNTIDCNEAGVRLYGFKDKEEYKEQFIKYCSPEYQPDGQRSDKKAVMLVNLAFTEGLCTFDWMHQTPDGKTMIPAKINLVRAKYGDDDVVLGYTHDLREQNRMIKEILEANEKNEIQLTKLNLMVESEHIGLWDFVIQEVDPFNPDNVNVYSDRFRYLIGYSDETDFPNILSSWAGKLHPEDADEIFNAFVAHLYDTTGNTPFHTEYRLLKKNGEYAYYSAACETVRAADGTPLRACGSLIDITERKKHEAERIQAHEALKQREAMLTATNKMAEILLSHEDEAFINVMSRGLKPVCDVAGIDRVAVYWRLSNSDHFGQIYLWQGKTIPLDDELRVLPDNPAVNRWIDVLSKDECINANTMDLPGNEADFLRAFGIKSMFAVPIFIRGKHWGFITLEDHTTYRYIEEDGIDLLQSAAHLCAGAIARNEMEREIVQLETENEQLFFDGLTGMYNRRYFDDAIIRVMKTASRTSGLLSLMMIDIDFFKQYNDTYGHLAGDDCLKTVAGVLSSSVLRPDDFVARYGGEEFVVVMPGVDETGARTVAERMIKNIHKCTIAHESSAAAKYVTFSIGVTTGKVERDHTPADFIELADKMLYKAKHNGRNRYCFDYV